MTVFAPAILPIDVRQSGAMGAEVFVSELTTGVTPGERASPLDDSGDAHTLFKGPVTTPIN